MPDAVAYCYRFGEIGFAQACPPGGVELATGPEEELRSAVKSLAVLGYDGKTLSVPGMREAESGPARAQAVRQMKDRIQMTLKQ